MLKLLDGAANGLAILQKQDAGLSTAEMQTRWRQLYGVIDQSVMRIYFAADIDPKLRRRTEKPLTAADRRKYFADTLPVFRKALSKKMTWGGQ